MAGLSDLGETRVPKRGGPRLGPAPFRFLVNDGPRETIRDTGLSRFRCFHLRISEASLFFGTGEEGILVMVQQRAAAHHAFAASHHKLAMDFHREASRHYQIGKDYAHAAHQALIAHGHTLKAMDHWRQAIDDYAEHVEPVHEKPPEYRDAAWPRYMEHLLHRPEECAVVVATSLSGSEHHAAAAAHAEQAARHHGDACLHCDGREFPLAFHKSQIAHGHALHSIFHSNEAARYHVEHNGRAGPSIELV